jgi:hypothetical protein
MRSGKIYHYYLNDNDIIISYEYESYYKISIFDLKIDMNANAIGKFEEYD